MARDKPEVRGESQTISAKDVATLNASDLVPTADGLAKASTGFEVAHREQLSELTAGQWLPRLQLFGANTEAVKAEKVPLGYSIVHGKDRYEYLGKEVIIWPVTVRRMGLDTSDRSKPIASYDLNDPEYARIKGLADSGVQNSGCQWGPQFLVWVPGMKSRTNKFCTFFMGNKSSRREAANFDPILSKRGFALLTYTLAQNNLGSWHTPLVNIFTGSIEMPPKELFDKELAKFQDPPRGAFLAVDPEAPDGASTDGDRAH
jgi:hypothetical protein